MLLGLMGGLLGLGVAYGGLRLLIAMSPPHLPRLGEISMDPRALAFTLIVSLLSGLLFGVIPAFRYAPGRISAALRGGGRGLSDSQERHRTRYVLVVGQVALALVLLMSAGLMIRTFQALRSVEPGFTHPEQIQAMRISFPASLVREPERVARMQNDIVDKLGAIPGVTSVAFASALPLEGLAAEWDAIIAIDKNYPASAIAPLRLFKMVSPGFFKTAGTRLIAGRDYTWTDLYGQRPVAIVSENLARELWGTAPAALGKQLGTGFGAWREVIGVVEDVRENGVHEAAPATAYWPALAEDLYGPGQLKVARSVTFTIRTQKTGMPSFLTQATQAVWSVNGNLSVASLRSMQDIYNRSLGRTSFALVILGIAGAMALLLGLVGIYGVISYAVAQRKREIGIRLALGAQPGELKRMFVRHGLVLTGMGIVIGLGAAVALEDLMSSLLFGISPLDPVTYAGAPLVLAAAAMLASYLPARRASAVDPVEALKAE
jgi:predicted permease